MKFGSTRSHLYDAQKTARANWEAVQQVWQDRNRDEFDEQVFEPLDRLVTDALRGIDQLSAVFSQVRQECDVEAE